jgi:ABC-type transporter Mla maintaining outer membrane lipid asymmetry permease subunit MlaE
LSARCSYDSSALTSTTRTSWAIVLAGRTGAAFAAQIGAMQGNEEVDALSTLGISPVEFLVLPRMLALIVMTPLLCIYANAMGIFGGFIVGISTRNVTPTAYLLQTQAAVTMGDFAIGIIKGSVFGALIAVTGCLRGIEAGRSAAAVGAAATSAVVSGILAIIVSDAVSAVLLNLCPLSGSRPRYSCDGNGRKWSIAVWQLTGDKKRLQPLAVRRDGWTARDPFRSFRKEGAGRSC